MKNEHQLRIGGHDIKLSSLDKVMFPADGITKADVIQYYRQIAPYLITHSKDHPSSLERYPDGIGKKGFYQKEPSEYFPDYIETAQVMVRETGKRKANMCLNNAASLVYLANQGMITAHLWMSRKDKLEHPDRIIFDFDPEDAESFKDVMLMAKDLASTLQKTGLTAFPMLTGSKGMHVTIPIVRQYDFNRIKDYARHLAEAMVQKHPDTLTMEIRKDKREGRIFVDILRNEHAQTAVAPYSLRARDGAPVATPLHWSELTKALHPQKYTLRNIFKRLATKGDPWKDIRKSSARIKLTALP